jgi:hypothetical protein
MNTESYKTKRKGQPKRSGKVKGSKRHMARKSKETVIYNQPHLHATYSAKAEWIHAVMPPVKE